MRHHPASSLPFPPPNPTERAALTIAAVYLFRAGTAVASRLLGPSTHGDGSALWATLRDQLLSGAALCDGVIELADDAERDHGTPAHASIRVG